MKCVIVILLGLSIGSNTVLGAMHAYYDISNEALEIPVEQESESQESLDEENTTEYFNHLTSNTESLEENMTKRISKEVAEYSRIFKEIHIPPPDQF